MEKRALLMQGVWRLNALLSSLVEPNGLLKDCLNEAPGLDQALAQTNDPDERQFYRRECQVSAAALRDTAALLIELAGRLEGGAE